MLLLQIGPGIAWMTLRWVSNNTLNFHLSFHFFQLITISIINLKVIFEKPKAHGSQCSVYTSWYLINVLSRPYGKQYFIQTWCTQRALIPMDWPPDHLTLIFHHHWIHSKQLQSFFTDEILHIWQYFFIDMRHVTSCYRVRGFYSDLMYARCDKAEFFKVYVEFLAKENYLFLIEGSTWLGDLSCECIENKWWWFSIILMQFESEFYYIYRSICVCFRK